jgi:pyruvate carboxylase
MSGLTSQPSMGAVVGALKGGFKLKILVFNFIFYHYIQGTHLDTGLDMEKITAVNEYWEECRAIYAPFESGQKSGSADVYIHEMPGGQYTNLLFQSQQLGSSSMDTCNSLSRIHLINCCLRLGLSGRWPSIKKAYASANRLLGDIIKGMIPTNHLQHSSRSHVTSFHHIIIPIIDVILYAL